MLVLTKLPVTMKVVLVVTVLAATSVSPSNCPLKQAEIVR